MRMTRGWTGLRTAVIALGLIAWSAPHADADGIRKITSCNTAPRVPSGPTGSPAPAMSSASCPCSPRSVDTASNISLGYFQVAPLAAGQSTTYNDTTFTMTFGPGTFNSTALSDAPITVTGHLNGTVTGPYQSSVQVSFDPISSPTFAVAGGTGTLSLLKNDQELLVPSSVNNGQTTLQAQIATAGIPTHRARAQHHRAVPQHGGRPRPQATRAEPAAAGRGLTRSARPIRHPPRQPPAPAAPGVSAPRLQPCVPRRRP